MQGAAIGEEHPNAPLPVESGREYRGSRASGSPERDIARFQEPREQSLQGGGEKRIAGLTLPGTPTLVAGSTGAIAWGFTNTMGDWGDVVVLETDPDDPDLYRTPDGPRRLERIAETIRVRGADDEVLEVAATVWGPIVRRDPAGRLLAFRWVAHDPEAVNLELSRLVDEIARTSDVEAHVPGAEMKPDVVQDGEQGWDE